MALKMHHSLAVHPGVWLRQEIMDPHGVTIEKLVEAFGVSRQSISAVVNGRAALTEEMAIRFEKAFGVSADTLVRMQSAYGMAKAREHEDQIHVGRVLEAA
jgi:addiction module HigA family antidote